MMGSLSAPLRARVTGYGCYATGRVFLVLLLLCTPASVLGESEPERTLSDESKAEFLRTAKVVKFERTRHGITGTWHLTLSDEHLVHGAHHQSIHKYHRLIRTKRRHELMVWDSYRHNIAAYRLARMLELDLVPVSVERRVKGRCGAVTWWIDDVLMTELDRRERGIEPPERDPWNEQRHTMIVFDQLIDNFDRNQTNIVIDTDWKLWLIDHSRAFGRAEKPPEPKFIRRCDRKLLENLRRLDKERLNGELKPFLREATIDLILKRRDEIVRILDERITKYGEAAVLFDSL